MSRFVVQLHDATTLHFDLRIQVGEVLRSWAVPKGPSLDPSVRRLAVPVEDHSLSAGDFEGVHTGQARGTGAVIIWDEGTAEIIRDEPSHLSVLLHGSKLTGGFALTQTGARRWILVKTRDDDARSGSDIVAEEPGSVRSGRTWEDLANEGLPLQMWLMTGSFDGKSVFDGRKRVTNDPFSSAKHGFSVAIPDGRLNRPF
jgi:DNA ligase D-like protein (predicted 3'-phosphoesterase)